VVAAVAKVAHLTRAFFVWQHFFYITDERFDDTGLRRTHARAIDGAARHRTARYPLPGEGGAVMEELLLWRWSTLVQITSAWMLMVFFIVVRRSTGRRDLDAWMWAWIANGVALAVSCVYWLLQPPAQFQYTLTALYVSSKTVFLLLLLLGTIAFVRQSHPRLRTPVAIAIAVACIVSLVVTGSIPAIGLAQCVIIVGLLGTALAWCLRHPGNGLGWLGLGFALRCGLALAEGLGYGMSLVTPPERLPHDVQTFLAVHSSFDTGAEWVIALGCVLAYSHRVQHELARTNADLRLAQAGLLAAAHTDALTGLHNRRMLPQLFEHAAERGGHLLFFDVDGLKAINDREGHFAGDAALHRFGEALRDVFDGHATLRYAGDEFVAMVPAEADPAALVEALRERLAASHGRTGIEFSVGLAALAPGADLRVALDEADAAMYRDKQAKAGRAHAV
jgi:diguanylate cyclase (GGDEF)-like protein